MHFNQGQSEVQCSGELENMSTKWGWAEALQKKLEDCRSLWISQQLDRTRNYQINLKRNRFMFAKFLTVRNYKPCLKLPQET